MDLVLDLIIVNLFSYEIPYLLEWSPDALKVLKGVANSREALFRALALFRVNAVPRCLCFYVSVPLDEIRLDAVSGLI